MVQEKILSVGIDIGTTTTQIIVSEFTIQNVSNTFFLPRDKIVKKRIIYRSQIYFTPLLSEKVIDLVQLKGIICKEYEYAGIQRKDISTGAVIITGETARKENAEKVLSVLSDFAGDFVVSTAGADLEAVLAGYGSGAAAVSHETTKRVINFDIGGGTTNAAVFSDGIFVDSFALNIGARLIRFSDQYLITYISSRIRNIINHLELSLRVGEKPKFNDLHILCEKLAKVLLKISENKALDVEESALFINHRNKNLKVEKVMFSGGVSEFIYSDKKITELTGMNQFGDLGPLLGDMIRDVFAQTKNQQMKSKEKIRATVIGAGIHSIRLSGSTITFEQGILPLKNIPVVKLHNDAVSQLDQMTQRIREKIILFAGENVAIAFQGPKAPNYPQVIKMADSIVKAHSDNLCPIIVIVENDFAKALGQVIQDRVVETKKVICIDGIKVDTGDYIDIGKPIANTLPVVVKTLIFN